MNNTETINILRMYGVNRYTGEEQSDNQLLCDANDNVVVVQTDIQQASQNKLILRLKPTKPAAGEFALYKAFKDVCETFTEYVPIGEPYYLNQYCTDIECLYEVDITEAVQDCNLFVIVSKGGSITFAEDVSIVEQPIVNYDFVKDGATLQQEFGTHSVIEANMQRGNLFVAQHLYSAQGNHLPASFGLAYNDRFAKTNVVYGKPIIAKGWKLNYQQFIQFVGDRCLYVDSAFKEHIFTKSDNDPNVYIDSSAQTGYILKKHDNYCEIFDGANTTLCFRSGRLVEITQRKGETPVKTTIYYANGKICKITDGLGKDYFIQYQNSDAYIMDASDATLVTLFDDGDEGSLEKITYLDGKDCLFEIDDTYRLSIVTDESTKEKLVIDYNNAGKLAALKKYAVHNTTETSLENVFIYYSTPNCTILSKNKGTNQDLSQIRYRYNFDSNGAVTSVGEIDAAGNPIGTQSFVEKTAVYEKQYTLMGNNKVVNLGSESFERLPELSMSPPYITPENMAASIESKNGTMLRFSWDIHCDSELDLADEVVEFNIFVNGCPQDNACRSYACSSDTIHDSCFVEMPMQQDNISIEIQAIPSMFNVPVVVSNVQVEYVPFATKQLYAKISISPDAELPIGCFSEMIGDSRVVWKAIDTVELSTDYGTISGLFTFADYQKTLLSYVNNPNSFNLYYNDGKSLLTNVSNLKTGINGSMVALDKRPFATLTTSNGQQSFSYIELVEDGLKLSQRLLGVESPHSYTMIDKHLLKVEQWQKNSPKVSYQYDSFGNIVDIYLIKNSNNELQTTSIYSQDGQQLVANQDYLNQHKLQTAYNYNTDGMLASVTYPNNHEVFYEYQHKNILSSVYSTIDSTVNANNVSYDGACITSLSHNDTTINFTYDNYNNVSQVQVAGTTLLSKQSSFNADGSYTQQLTYGNGYVVKAYYDKYDRLVQTVAVTGQEETPLATYIYSDSEVDATCNQPNYSTCTSASLLRKAIDNCANLVYNYTYDNQNACTKVQVVKNGVQQWVKEVVTDQDGRKWTNTTFGTASEAQIKQTVDNSQAQSVTEQQVVNGVELTTTYNKDSLQRPTSITKNVDTSTLTQAYQYYPRVRAGKTLGATQCLSAVTTKLVVSNAELLNKTEQIAYDANGNVTQYGTTTYAYDGIGRLVRENNFQLGKTFTWTYDAGGNITCRKEYVYTNGPLGEALSEKLYVYGTTWKDQLVSFNGNAITYDALGNPLSYKGNTFEWQRGRLLTKATLANGTVVNMTYYANGLRASKEIGDASYKYFYSTNGNLLQITTQLEAGETGDLVFVYDSTGVAGFTYNGNFYHYVRNTFGDVTDIYQSNNWVAHYTYDAFGNHTVYDPRNDSYPTHSSFIGNLNPIRYRSYFYDTDLGLYYLQSRYYDPQTGRFINADTLDYLEPESINGLNLYAYCYNNPIMYIDSDGHSPKWWQWALFGVGVALVAVAAVMASIGTGGVGAFGVGALIGSLAVGTGGAIVGGVIGYATEGVDGILGGALAGFGIGAIVGFLVGGSINYATYLRSTVVVDGQRVSVYRGGDSMKLKTGEYKILSNGTKRGISVNIDPTQVQNFGGAYRVQRVPRGLKIVQQGKNLSHFEIIPNKALSLSQYQALLNKVVLIGV